jgi:hypothetical protein
VAPVGNAADAPAHGRQGQAMGGGS